MEKVQKIRNYISKKMKEMNMTRAEFYKKCGFSKTSYYNLTANVPSMTLENIENIAKH